MISGAFDVRVLGALVLTALLCASACSDASGGDDSAVDTGGETGDDAGAVDTVEPVVCDPAPAPDDVDVWLVDVTDARGVDFVPTDNPIARMPGQGACVFDYDGDGHLDLYFVDAGGEPNRLYRNDGEAQFTEVLDAGAGVGGESLSCLPFDFDADGDLDLFIGDLFTNKLLRNDDGLFVDVSVESGIHTSGLNFGASAADFDGDGDLDLALARFLDPFDCEEHQSLGPWNCYGACGFPEVCPPLRNHLYINDGEGGFTEEGAERGIVAEDFTLSILALDFDQDGDVDIYAGNDTVTDPQRFYVNDGTGHFEEKAEELGLAWSSVPGVAGATMGVDFGDYDGDGIYDVVSSNLPGYPTQLYDCNASYVCHEVSDDHGLDDTYDVTSWAVQLIDLDHDGDLDLYSANGAQSVMGKEPDQLYRNEGGQFVPLVQDPPLTAEIRTSRGIATGDLDGDGDVDLVITNVQSPPHLLLNVGAQGHWLIVELDHQSAGATVEIQAGGRVQVEPVFYGGPYLTSNDPRVHFGLGEDCVAGVTVRWANTGETVTLTGVLADQVLRVDRP